MFDFLRYYACMSLSMHMTRYYVFIYETPEGVGPFTVAPSIDLELGL